MGTRMHVICTRERAVLCNGFIYFLGAAQLAVGSSPVRGVSPSPRQFIPGRGADECGACQCSQSHQLQPQTETRTRSRVEASGVIR